MKILQMLFILTKIIHSVQDHHPTCHPSSTQSTHNPTLIIFLVDQGINRFNKKLHWYFLKTLSCSIPVSKSIQTIVVDSSDNITNLVVNKETVYDSTKLGVELFKGFEKENFQSGRCDRLKKTMKSLLASDFVKHHPNVQFVIPSLDRECEIPNVGDKHYISIDFLPRPDGKHRYLTVGGQGDIDTTVSESPADLTRTTDTLVRMMISGQQPAAAATQSPSKVTNNVDISTIVAAGGYCIAVIFLITLIVIVVLCCKQRKSLNKLRKAAERDAEQGTAGLATRGGHEGGRKGGVTVKPPPAPRVVYKFGMTLSEYEDYCYYTPSERLPICEQLVKGALHHDKWGDPNAPPPPFPPPKHANY